MKLSDYVIRFLADHGVRHIFMVTGGASMHLNDSIGKEARIRYICNHHAQACAMAAEGYARVSGKPGVVCVTSGPAGINALGGVFGAWTDSIPMLVISGQIKRETCMAFHDVPGLRQLGDQEADIIGMVKGITKYSVLVDEPKTIRYHLEKALHLAEFGRPGPCWIDIPVDVQGSSVDEAAMAGYEPVSKDPAGKRDHLVRQCQEVIARIKSSPRPVVLVGSGVRLAKALDVFRAVITKLGVPVTTSWTAGDIVPAGHPLYCGMPGTQGNRAGNFAVQNAETLLVLGCRLNIRQVSYNWTSFAQNAFTIQVDIDPAELGKPTVKPDMPLHCDLGHFLEELNNQLDLAGYQSGLHADWIQWCKERVSRYPVVLPRHRTAGDFINPYRFIEVLFDRLASDDGSVWNRRGVRLYLSRGFHQGRAARVREFRERCPGLRSAGSIGRGSRQRRKAGGVPGG